MSNLITDSRDEQAFGDLFGDSIQIHIPIFQREYVWGHEEFTDLAHDIGLIKDTIEDCQFLGAIVAYDKPRQPGIQGRLQHKDVVDGQQRLITLYIFILAIAERLFYYDSEGSAQVIQDFLLLPERKGLEINTRIVPSLKDRNQFRTLWDRINSPELLRGLLKKNPPKPPLPSGDSSGSLVKQYERIIKWLKKEAPNEPRNVIEYLQVILEIITRNLTFVHLSLTDASVATKIFERLNYRGVKVGIFGLVRNEVFSRISESGEESIRVHETIWRPFEAKFRSKEEGFFFPYCLIHNSNLKKSGLFAELRTIWKELDPIQIVEHMKPYQVAYMAICTGEASYENKKLNDCIERLYDLRAPTAIYPFIMNILCAFQSGALHVNIAVSILNFVESFLVRRAIMGFEPTGLHAIFKGLWNDINSNPNDKLVKDQILRRPTIQYPTNSQILEALKTRPIAKARICHFILAEYDKSLPGDTPSDKLTIEHVLPQSFDENGDWAKAFSKEEHKILKDTLANVIPLSGPLNSSVQASPYKIKSKRYAKESMFVSARDFSEKWKEWTPNEVQERNNELFNWIKKRWKE